MDNVDITVTANDVQEVRQQLERQGFKEVALDLFETEPVLAERFALRWAKVRDRLVNTGLSEQQVESVMQSVAKMVVETLALVVRGQRRLWDDFLPASEEGKDGGHG